MGEHALNYVRGLLLASGRKSVEPMALVFGGPVEDERDIWQSTVLAWQRLVMVSPWEAGDVQRGIQAVFNKEEFVPSASEWSAGVVGVIDESGFVKRGTETDRGRAPVVGRLWKNENCQVGVFVVGVTPAGTVQRLGTRPDGFTRQVRDVAAEGVADGLAA